MSDREMIRSKIKDKLRTLSIRFDDLHFDLDEIVDQIVDNERVSFWVDSSFISDQQEDVIEIMKRVIGNRAGSFWSGESKSFYFIGFYRESENVYELSLG